MKIRTRPLLCAECKSFKQDPNPEIGLCTLDEDKHPFHYDSRCIYGLLKEVECPSPQDEELVTVERGNVFELEFESTNAKQPTHIERITANSFEEASLTAEKIVQKSNDIPKGYTLYSINKIFSIYK